MSFTLIETPRLLMRQFLERDLDAYSEMCADPEVMRYIGDGRPLTRGEAWRNMATMIGHWNLRGYGNWAVEEKRTGTLVGRIGFWNPEGWPGFELGWLLARNYWGQGLATEGARAALDYGFTSLEQNHVISVIRADNSRSIRVAERLGETYDRNLEVLGQNALIYGISKAQWIRLSR